MHVGLANLWSTLLLVFHHSVKTATECTVRDKDAKLSLSPVVQFYAVDPSKGIVRHAFLSTTSAIDGLALDLLNFTMPVVAGLLPGSNSCPADCLTSLTPYVSETELMVVMLRPVDVVNFPGYTDSGIGSIYCSVFQGHCGADVPLYLYYSPSYRDYYVGLASENRSTYLIQNSGRPQCFVWSNINYTTTIAATTLLTSTAFSTIVPSYPANTTTNYTANSTVITATSTTFTTNNFNIPNATTTSNNSSASSHYTTATVVTTSMAAQMDNSQTAGPVTTVSTAGITGTSTMSPNPNSTAWHDGMKQRRTKSASRFWPVALAAVVLIGAFVLTVLALSSLRIIRSNKDRVVPYQSTTSPPPPYNTYNHDPSTTNLPPAPVDAMTAPRPFTVGALPGPSEAAALY